MQLFSVFGAEEGFLVLKTKLLGTEVKTGLGK